MSKLDELYKKVVSHHEAPIFVSYVSDTDRTAVWPTGKPFPVKIDEKGDSPFEIQTRGPWGTVSKIRGLAVEKTDRGLIVHGKRSLDKARESGYDMEGRVNIQGKSYRAFTSSQLFLVNGELVSVAILYVVKRKS
jgi:hypothetical protein